MRDTRKPGDIFRVGSGLPGFQTLFDKGVGGIKEAKTPSSFFAYQVANQGVETEQAAGDLNGETRTTLAQEGADNVVVASSHPVALQSARVA
ncbi:hypothetical protein VTH82DRAFT_3737 [Thermothelomyces myriococcoides]